jgi:hypothetical protein
VPLSLEKSVGYEVLKSSEWQAPLASQMLHLPWTPEAEILAKSIKKIKFWLKFGGDI